MDNDSDMVLPFDGEFQKAKSIGNVADGEGQGFTHRLVQGRSRGGPAPVSGSLLKVIFFEVGIRRVLMNRRSQKNSQKIYHRIRLPKHQIEILKFENQFWNLGQSINHSKNSDLLLNSKVRS